MLRKIKFPVVRRPSSVVRKEIILSILSSFLLILSFPRFNIEFLAWVGFVPLFFAIENKSKIRAFFISYLTGIIFWLGVIYWLVHVTAIGMIVLILYLALYFGLFGLIVSTYLLPTTYYLLFIPSVWVLLEYLRSRMFTGFGWALLGYTQYLNLPIIQMADIIGVWGVSFLVMMVNVVIKEVLGLRSWVLGKRKQVIFMIIYCFLFISFTVIYGYYKIHQTPNTKHQTPIKISVIQGNIPQELKWNKEARDLIINKYLELTNQAVKDNPDLIIWPEAALPCVLEEELRYYEKASNLIKQVHIPLLLGAATSRNNLYYNSALLILKNGKTQAQYDKLHLVPFGEYIPLRKILGFLETIVPIGDFTSGKEYTIFNLPTTYYLLPTRFSVLICFEDLFPELSREFTKRGAEFLVNITNDAWFKRTSAPYQHLCASVFRAVENRVFLVRAANTGLSGFIAPSGKIISLVQNEKGKDIFVSGYDTQDIAISISVSKTALSFYTRYGDIFILFCFIFILFSMVYFI